MLVQKIPPSRGYLKAGDGPEGMPTKGNLSLDVTTQDYFPFVKALSAIFALAGSCGWGFWKIVIERVKILNVPRPSLVRA